MTNVHLSRKNQWRLTTGLIAIGMILFSILFGCVSGNYGNISPSREVTDTFNSYQVLPDHRYYFYGPDAQPFYIVGIEKGYTLQSKFWKPVDLTPQQIDRWLNFTGQRSQNRMDTYGANIVGPAGEKIGVWYSVQDWSSTGTVRLEAGNVVHITMPDRRRSKDLASSGSR